MVFAEIDLLTLFLSTTSSFVPPLSIANSKGGLEVEEDNEEASDDMDVTDVIPCNVGLRTTETESLDVLCDEELLSMPGRSPFGGERMDRVGDVFAFPPFPFGGAPTAIASPSFLPVPTADALTPFLIVTTA